MAEQEGIRKGHGGGGEGSVSVVGIGPGGLGHLTAKAAEALGSSDAVVGYSTYLDLVAPLTEGIETFSTGMTREEERCVKALELAATGRRVAVVSSGDAGIYGMAGLVLQLAIERGYKVDVGVVPGVPAFVAASSVLGAPLMHDFASVSLSDLLTPWETIEKRVEAAAGADFVIALYNPKSKKRVEGLKRAFEIVSRHRSPETPVGIVRNATREGESAVLTTLAGAPSHFDTVDMLTTVIIGNSSSFASEGVFITPRGYRGVSSGRAGAEKAAAKEGG